LKGWSGRHWGWSGNNRLSGSCSDRQFNRRDYCATSADDGSAPLISLMELPRSVSRHELSILRFPDRRTDWVVILIASLERSLDIGELTRRIGALHLAIPMVGARLRHEVWHPGEPPEAVIVKGEPLDDLRLDAAFDLAMDPPVRFVLGNNGRRLAVACHHAAFDGRAQVAILVALLGGPLPTPVTSEPPGPPGSKSALIHRLFAPADRVAPSQKPPGRDSYVSEEVDLSGPSVTARLAEACVDAAASHNRRFGAPWRRVGISVAKGGPAGVGNVASYRRLDLQAGEQVVPPVVAALLTPDEPIEQTGAGLALALTRPIVNRFSDSLLISNLGRQFVPDVTRLEFFPVARGRSAIAFGAVGLAAMPSTLSLRARDLSMADAQQLLGSAVQFLRRSRSGDPFPDRPN
jgi:hypothetical protein